MKTQRSPSNDFRMKKAVFKAPPLELSSKSGSMDEAEETDDVQERSPIIKIIPMLSSKKQKSTTTTTSLEDNAASPQQENPFSKPSELLKAAAALHFGSAEERKSMIEEDQKERHVFRSSNSVLETRSTLSSPGKINVTLRDKFRRMSRNQRKSALKNHQNNDSPIQQGKDRIDDSLRIVPEKIASHGGFPAENSAVRLERQSRYNSIGTVPTRRRSNRIQLHIYDLLSQDALMQLPWGFVCEIGKCFNDVNSACHELGTGAYHVGIEVNGTEYAFGATNIPGKSGVFACTPKMSPGYQYRTTIDFGELPLVRSTWVTFPKQGEGEEYPTTVYRQVEEYIDGQQVIKEMQTEYMGRDYDLLRKNCCTFAREACIRMGVEEDVVPSWFSNLAESGATTHDMALQTVEPIKGILTSCEEETATVECLMPLKPKMAGDDAGFEVVAQRNTEGTKDVLIVMESKPSRAWCADETDEIAHAGFRRTLTWTY